MFQQAGQKYDLETITGIEFAVQYNRFQSQEIHIVGLGFSSSSEYFKKQIKEITDAREIRNEKMISALNKLGFAICYNDIKQNAEGNIITRAHFANVLVHKKIVKTTKEAFEKYLSINKPAYVERQTLTPANCIETIQKSGGVAVLAHPTLYHMNDMQIEFLAEELKSYGLNAMETAYHSYTSQQQKKLMKLADKLCLLYSGGSDFHGANRENVQLGTLKNNFKIPYNYWEALKKQCTHL